MGHLHIMTLEMMLEDVEGMFTGKQLFSFYKDQILDQKNQWSLYFYDDILNIKDRTEELFRRNFEEIKKKLMFCLENELTRLTEDQERLFGFLENINIDVIDVVTFQSLIYDLFSNKNFSDQKEFDRSMLCLMRMYDYNKGMLFDDEGGPIQLNNSRI